MEDEIDEQPTYQFRWDGYTLDRYLENMQARADRLRLDAQILITRAEAIEEEKNKLSTDLKPT